MKHFVVAVKQKGWDIKKKKEIQIEPLKKAQNNKITNVAGLIEHIHER